VVLPCQRFPFKKATDLKGKRIATELVNVTRDYFRKKGVKVAVEFPGSDRGKGPELVDRHRGAEPRTGLVRCAPNNLRIVDVVLESTPS